MPHMVPEYYNGKMYYCPDIESDYYPSEHFTKHQVAEECGELGSHQVEASTGHFVRLSAPGFLDATEWIGPFDTSQEAKDAVIDEWGVDPVTGEELPEDIDPGDDGGGIHFLGGFPTDQGWREIGVLGDVNPVEYGGGVIYKHPQGHRFVLWTDGLEGLDASEVDQRDEWATELTVYSVHLPDTGADLLDDTDWVEWSRVAESIGVDEGDLLRMLRQAGSDDEGAITMASAIWDIASYYGWHELDHCPRRYPARVVADMMGHDAPEEEEDEGEEGFEFHGRRKRR